MLKFLKKISILLVSILIIANLLSYFSLKFLRQGDFYKPSFLSNTVEENNFDYIILGASTGLTTLNTKLIDSIIGKNGINLSIDDSSLSTQYLMLQHFFAEGRTTNICVLAPSVKSYDYKSETVSANDYRFLPFIERDYVRNYFQSFSGIDANLLSNSKTFPFLGVSYYNVEVLYPSILTVFKPHYRNRFDSKGNYTYPVNTNIKDDSVIMGNKKTLKVEFINPDLKKIKALCEKEGIELICYISPMKYISITTDNADYKIINHSNVLTKSNYFFDDVHVNRFGRQETSVQFSKDITSYFNK